MQEIRLETLTKGEVRNLSGQERGLEARAAFHLNDRDNDPEPVRVVVPRDLDALSTSFFQGMFAASVQRFQSREGFLRHYRFDGSPMILRQIDRGIRAVLTKRHSALEAA